MGFLFCKSNLISSRCELVKFVNDFSKFVGVIINLFISILLNEYDWDWGCDWGSF